MSSLDYFRSAVAAGAEDVDMAPGEEESEIEDGQTEPESDEAYSARWAAWYDSLTPEQQAQIGDDPDLGVQMWEQAEAEGEAEEFDADEDDEAEPDDDGPTTDAEDAAMLAWYGSLSPAERATLDRSPSAAQERAYRAWRAASEALGIDPSTATPEQATYAAKVARGDRSVPLRRDASGQVLATALEMSRLSAQSNWDRLVRDSWREDGIEPDPGMTDQAAFEARMRGGRVERPTGSAPDLWRTMTDEQQRDAVAASWAELAARRAAQRAR